MKHLVAAWALSATVLSGCATNALVVESADEVGAMASGLSAAARVQLEKATERRDEAYASVIASDASCRPNNPIYVFVPTIADETKRPPGPRPPLCAATAEQTLPGYATVELDFGPVAAEAIEPTYHLIGAIAAYGTAISKIIESPRADVSADIATALELAGRAEALAKGLGASGLPSIQSLSNEQVDTAASLIQFFADLAREKQQAAAMRTLHAEKGKVVDDAIIRVKAQIEAWNKVVSGGSARIERNSLKRAYASEAEKMDFAARRDFVSLIMDVDKEPGRIAAATAKFSKAADTLTEANQELGQLLAGNLNDEQKKRRAAISRRRFVQAFSLTVDALLAWKVI